MNPAEKEKTETQDRFHYLTETKVSKLITRLSVPTIISMLVTAVYNAADTFFVGRISTQATAAVLRAKTDVMATASKVRENCDDILADAKEINEQRALEEEAAVIADQCEEIADTSEE